MIRTEHLSDSVTLHLGDCRDVLPTLPRADVTITDPPYAEKTHAGARTGGGEEVLIDFASISEDDFVGLCERLCAHSERWVLMTCDWVHAAAVQSRLPSLFVRTGVWIKPNGMPQYTGDRPAMGFEAVAILHRDGKKHWNGGGSHAVWTEPKVNGEHPTQKPLPLVSTWMSLFSDPGEIILDPYCGSGTTGVAAVQTGRGFTGIEKDPKWFDLARRRISDALARPDLFVDRPARARPVKPLELPLNAIGR